MLTNNLIDNLIKDLMKKYEYQIVLKPLTRKERREWTKDFLMNSNIKTIDDSLFKFMFNGSDDESCRLIQFVFKNYLNIDIDFDEIISIRNEMTRQHKRGKTSVLDSLFSLEKQNTIVDIEPQSDISDKRLMPKLERYLATMRVFESNIGNDDESTYAFIHLICFYETKYKGDYPKGAVIVSNDGYHWIHFTDASGNIDLNSKQDLLIVDLEYSTEIFRKEGIENMSDKKMFEFALANAHIMNDEIQNAINKMAETSQAVRDLLSKRFQYLASPENRYTSLKHQMDLNTQYYEGVDDGIEKGIEKGIVQGHDEEYEKLRKQNCSKVKYRFIEKYDVDVCFSDDLSYDEYDYIDNLIFKNASLDEIKTYVEALQLDLL
ncbi:MAG: hypothetical protein LUG60_04640 [Erysipelotrichaceae bacterium]|nr:hypothetical protein [Erysipelotrichaceae bacterium]